MTNYFLQNFKIVPGKIFKKLVLHQGLMKFVTTKEQDKIFHFLDMSFIYSISYAHIFCRHLCIFCMSFKSIDTNTCQIVL